MDVVANLPPSGGYTNITTAMVVFSRYSFAYPVFKADAPTIAKVIIDIMCKHTYLPTKILSDKDSQFLSQVVTEVAAVLAVQLCHASTKHAGTIGLLERTHATLK